MSHELLIRELRTAQSPEQKAAIVADAIMKDLSSDLADVAIKCSFLPWFSKNVIQSFLGTESNESSIKKIISLPFVETLSLGYCFHQTTRRGLLEKYKIENPSKILTAFNDLQKLKPEPDSSIQSLVRILYGYVLTNQAQKAEELLVNLLEEGRIEEFASLSILDEAEELCISDGIGLTPKYWFYRGSVFLVEENFKETIKCADNALNLDKSYYHAYSIRSVAKGKLGSIDEAFLDIERAIQAKPDDVLYRGRATLYTLKRDYKNGIFDFTRAIRHNPTATLSYIGRANLYLLSDKREKAIRDLEVALELSDDKKTKVFVYTNYARFFVAEKNFKKALFYLDEVNQIEPNSGTYRRKGNILFKLKRYDDALVCYEQSLDMNNSNAYSYLGKGKYYLIKGNYENALLNFTRALSINVSKNLLPLNALDIKEVNLRLWETYLLLGDLDKAEEQKNILVDTINEKEIFEILFFCRRYSLFETMLEVSKKFIDNHSELPLSYTPAGYASNQLGDYQVAIRYFEKEKEKFPDGIIDKINIGVSHWGLNDFEKAKDYFEQANKELNKILKNNNFNSVQNRNKANFSERLFLKAMFGNLSSALNSIDEYLQSEEFNLDMLYNLRDWGRVIKRHPVNSPEGFDEFYNRITKVLNDVSAGSIYELASGI